MSISGASLGTKSYNYYIKDQVNIFNSTSEFYTDRCYVYKNRTTGLDMPLGTRVNSIFPGVGFSCGDNCEVSSITPKYMVCRCTPRNFATGYVFNYTLPSPSNNNYDLLQCTKVGVSGNIGFYLGLSIFIICSISILLFLLIDKTTMNVDKIQPNDNVPKIIDTRDMDKGVAIKSERNKADETDKLKKDHNESGELKPENRGALVLFEKNNNIEEGHKNAETHPADTKLYKMPVPNVNGDESEITLGSYYIDCLIDHHLILSTYLPTKYAERPRLARVVLLFMVISIEFLFNAILYTDTMINERNTYYYFADSFWDVIVYQLFKSICSSLIALGVYAIFFVFITKFGAEHRRINWTFWVLTAFATGIFIFSWYFYVVFNGVYTSTQLSWLYGGIISMIFNYAILQTIIPLVLAILMKYCSMKRF